MSETRKAELEKIVFKKGTENDIKAAKLIDEIVFLEDQMQYLKELPFISVNPKNPAMQKTTPAAKQYKEFLQQYNNSLRLLLKLCGDLGGDTEEVSPLREWIKSRSEDFE